MHFSEAIVLKNERKKRRKEREKRGEKRGEEKERGVGTQLILKNFACGGPVLWPEAKVL